MNSDLSVYVRNCHGAVDQRFRLPSLPRVILEQAETRFMTFEVGKSGNPGGRPKGSRSKRAMLLDEIVSSVAARLGVDPDEASFDAHTFLAAVYRNALLPLELRMDAAKAALRFERPALAATTLVGDVNLTVSVADRLARLRAKRRAAIVDGSTVTIASEPVQQMEAV